jgi:hypothetical protein
MLGVTADRIGRYLRAHPCADCGQPVITPKAERCGTCNLAELRSRSQWTTALIIAAISQYAAMYGEPPSPLAWARPRDPRWPNRATVVAYFGTFAAALRAAGFKANDPVAWSHEVIITRLRAWRRKHGRSPTIREWRAAPAQPSVDTVIRRFGSWRAAVDEADRGGKVRVRTARPRGRTTRAARAGAPLGS